jgi:hypothetical protein
MPRRAQTSTPPKPSSDILANAANGSASPGGDLVTEGEISGRGDGSRRRILRTLSRFKAVAKPGPSQFGVYRSGMSLLGHCFSQLLPPILELPACRLWK